MKSFVRAKRYQCGEEYVEVDLFEMTDMAQRGKPLRKEKKNPSTKDQVRRNRKRALKNFRLMIRTNFTRFDYYMTFTFSPANMPKTEKEAKKEFHNFIRRLNRKRKRLGIPAVKYMGTMEKKEKQTGTAYHFHFVISGGMSREKMEDVWGKGLCNASRLRTDDEELMQRLCSYIMKEAGKKEKSSHTYIRSRNLKKPVVTKNDWRFSHRKLNELAGLTDCPEAWEKLYPGYQFIEAGSTFGEMTGWHITVKMTRSRHDRKRIFK